MQNETKPAGGQPAKNAPVGKETFNFSGEGEYVPMNIEAASYDEAVKEWRKVRVLQAK